MTSSTYTMDKGFPFACFAKGSSASKAVSEATLGSQEMNQRSRRAFPVETRPSSKSSFFESSRLGDEAWQKSLNRRKSIKAKLKWEYKGGEKEFSFQSALINGNEAEVIECKQNQNKYVNCSNEGQSKIGTRKPLAKLKLNEDEQNVNLNYKKSSRCNRVNPQSRRKENPSSGLVKFQQKSESLLAQNGGNHLSGNDRRFQKMHPQNCTEIHTISISLESCNSFQGNDRRKEARAKLRNKPTIYHHQLSVAVTTFQLNLENLQLMKTSPVPEKQKAGFVSYVTCQTLVRQDFSLDSNKHSLMPIQVPTSYIISPELLDLTEANARMFIKFQETKCQGRDLEDDFDESLEDEWEYYDDDSQEGEEEEEKKEVANLDNFGIPAGLLTRWDYTIWDDDDDDDDYEDESIEEFSPYNKDVVDIKKRCSIPELKQWLEKIGDPKGLLFHQLNQQFHSDNSLCRNKKRKLKEGTFAEEMCQEDCLEVSTSEVHYCSGKRHGIYRHLTKVKQCLQVGVYFNGKDHGPTWQLKNGRSYLFTINQPNKESNVMSQVESCYIYPDLVHAIVGVYKNDHLVGGKYGYISRLEFLHGIPMPIVTVLDDQTNYARDYSTAFCISNTPCLRDPFEHCRVYVDYSRIPYAGEGLFAKQDMEQGSLVALFNGVRKRESTAPNGHHKNFSDYKITLNREQYLDITNDLAKTENYCATLGHKACHSFSNNGEFCELYHPRFGQIMSIVAKRDIHRGEEILVSYNYSFSFAPDWYKDVYFYHLRYVEKRSEEYIYQLAKKQSKDHGIQIVVPAPPKDSDRFVSCGVCEEHVGLHSYCVLCNQCSHWHHVNCLSEPDKKLISDAVAESLELTWICQTCK